MAAASVDESGRLPSHFRVRAGSSLALSRERSGLTAGFYDHSGIFDDCIVLDGDDIIMPLDLSLDRALDQALAIARDLAVDRGRVLVPIHRTDFARAFDLLAAKVRSRQGIGVGPIPERVAGDRVLMWLARLLPTVARSRFVAEAQGNLGDCERWWQRVDHLVCLAIGMPRLAWMMRREGRRGRV